MTEEFMRDNQHLIGKKVIMLEEGWKYGKIGEIDAICDYENYVVVKYLLSLWFFRLDELIILGGNEK